MRRKDDIPPPLADAQLAQLTARVDQAMAICDRAMRANTANRDLVDLCLDVTNALRTGRS